MRLCSIVIWFFLLFTVYGRTDNIALFYALDVDLAEFKKTAQELGQPAMLGSRAVHRLQIAHHTVYAVRMGSGAVSSAASAQALLTRFRCDWAFSLGPAGALSDDLGIGTWHRIANVIAWQRGTGGAGGFQLAKDSSWVFTWSPPMASNVPASLATTSFIALASGEAFIASEQDRTRIRETTSAVAVDMNTFGLALVCEEQQVPLFVWRIISDHADEKASEDFRVFATSYNGSGGLAIAKYIWQMPSNTNAASSYSAIQKYLNQAPP